MKVRLDNSVVVWPRNNNPAAQLGVVAAFCTVGWLVDNIIDESYDARVVQAITDIIWDTIGHPFKSRPVDEHIVGEITRQ